MKLLYLYTGIRQADRSYSLYDTALLRVGGLEDSEFLTLDWDLLSWPPGTFCILGGIVNWITLRKLQMLKWLSDTNRSNNLNLKLLAKGTSSLTCPSPSGSCTDSESATWTSRRCSDSSWSVNVYISVCC